MSVLKIKNRITGEWDDVTSVRGGIGPAGAKGDRGADFSVKGYFDTLTALQIYSPNPAAGDAYGIGTEAPFDIYIYDGVNDRWVNNGPIQGVRGPEGPRGPQGAQGLKGNQGDTGTIFTPSVSSDGVITWTNNGNLENPASVNIKGPQGRSPVKGTDYFTAADKAAMILELSGALQPSSIGAIKDPTTKTAGYFLKWNGTAWVASALTNAVLSVNGETGTVTTRLLFSDVEVATEDFEEMSTPTYEDYPYLASVALEGATDDMLPEIIFSLADIQSDLYAPICESYDGGIYIYAKDIPDEDITIPQIILWK